MITIQKEAKKDKKKPVIVITSRVHSGETPASIVFKGIFDFLTGDSKEARFLRKFYTFILIPCLNPDGVVCGNYRNCIVGIDLNRQWINPDQEFQPEIYHTKQMLKNITEVEKRQIWIYCDIHGHSKKQNAFFYGCNTAANGGFLSWTIVRLLPRIFAQKTHLFNIKDCRFKVEPYKIGTGRVVAWKQFQITHSFTLENSFYGFDRGQDEVVEFSEEDYQGIGAKFVESIYEMHFVWKQIRRELQITNGWLKPRVLFDATGIPAAQLLSEELIKKKKAEQRQVAIEQYQLFLKKFYNGKTAQNKNKPNQLADQSQLPMQSMFIQNSIAQNSTIPLNIYNKQNIPGLSHKTSKFAQGRGLDKIGASNDEVSMDIKQSPLFGSQFRQNAQRIQFNNDLDGGTNDDETDPLDFMEKALIGLVKIQARIRGVLARKQVEKLIFAQRKQHGKQIEGLKQKPRLGRDISSSIQKHSNSNSVLQTFNSQRSGEPLRSASFNENRTGQKTSENSLDAELLNNLHVNNPLQESKDTLSCSHLERMSSRRINLLTKDWRLYFQERELDDAFQVVEIEKREISEEGSSAGSSSNPSEDNLDAEEIYEKVYKLPPQKRIEMIQMNKELEQKFKTQVKDQNKTKDLLYQKAKDANENGKNTNAARNIQTSVPTRRGTLKFYRGFNNKTNSGSNINQGQSQGAGFGQGQGNGQGQDFVNQAKNSENNAYYFQKKNGLSPYFQYNQNNQLSGQASIIAQQALIQRNSSAHSPISTFEQPFSMHDYNLSTKNIAFNQINGRALQIQKYQHRDGGKNRATTSHASANASITNHSLMQNSHYQNSVHSSNNHNQMRLFNLNYKAALGKRENINQVIKDCFITKKCGVKKPPASPMLNQNQIQQNTRTFNPQMQVIYETQGQPSGANNRRNLTNSEQKQAMAQKQNDISFKITSNYYNNAGSSSKKTRRIKRNKNPTNINQPINQTMFLQMQSDNVFQISHQIQPNTLFMHPNYPFVAQSAPISSLPIYGAQAVAQEQQRAQLVQMAKQVQPHQNLQSVQHTQQTFYNAHTREQAPPQRGQIVRVQIAGKQPGINTQLVQRNHNVPNIIRHDQMQLSENHQNMYQYFQTTQETDESILFRKTYPTKNSVPQILNRHSPSQSQNTALKETPQQNRD